MQDHQLYQQILGLTAPWRVSHVELKLEEGEVHVWLEHEAGAEWCCPECGQRCPLYDHSKERTWRHLDTCQFQTLLHASVPRSECPEHGVRLVAVPWAEPHGHFTALFERLAIDWMQEAGRRAVARRLELTWEQVDGIMQRAVRRGLTRRRQEVVSRMGVDEKSFQKRHEYVTVVCDLDQGRVLYVGDDRKRETLDAFYQSLSAEQLCGIEAVAMDMWDPYVSSTQAHVPNAKEKIVFDKFHVAKHLNEAVDKVRRQEHKELQAQGDERLKGTKYWWLKNPRNFTFRSWREFAALRDSELKTARAWSLKETAMHLWEYRRLGVAKRFFQRWYNWATRSRLEPLKAVARTLKGHLQNVLTYVEHRITNAQSESLNSKIQWIKYTARGFRSREGFRNAIYFHCGGLDLYPEPIPTQ
jgi:transposase